MIAHHALLLHDVAQHLVLRLNDLLLLIHKVVGLLDVGAEVGKLVELFHIHVILSTVQIVIPSLRDNLGLLVIALTGQFVGLLNGAHTKNFKVGLLLELIFIRRGLETLSNYTDLSRTVESCIEDL
jgi:hypothetical protein